MCVYEQITALPPAGFGKKSTGRRDRQAVPSWCGLMEKRLP
jgi:hypothetical protein